MRTVRLSLFLGKLANYLLLLFVLGLLTAFPRLARAQYPSVEQIAIPATNYPPPTDGSARFIKPDGDNSRNGTSADQAWRTLQYALVTAPKGATIVIGGGTYRTGRLNVTKPLTLQPAPNEKVWLKGSLVVEEWTPQGSTWVHPNWTPRFPVIGKANTTFETLYNDPRNNKEYLSSAYPQAAYLDMVYLDGQRLNQVLTRAAVTTGQFFLDTLNSELVLGSSPVGKTVEATAYQFGLELESADTSGVTIRGLGLAHYAENAILVATRRVSLERNAVVYSGRVGVEFLTYWNRKSATTNDSRVTGNQFSYNGGKGFSASRSQRLLVEGNVFSYNNVENFSTGYDASGAKILRAAGMVVRNNVAEHNIGVGIWADISCENTLIVNNLVRYNSRFGIFSEICHRSLIVGNVVHDNVESGIHVSDNTFSRVFNNTCVRNGHNLHIDDTDRRNSDTAQYNRGITWIAKDNVAKNNLLSNVHPSRGGPMAYLSNCGEKQSNLATAPMIQSLDYNGYYRTIADVPRSTHAWTTVAAVVECKGATTLAAFRSATGYEVHGLEISGNPVNPFFVDEANNNFQLKPGSLAVRAGEPLPTDVATALGFPDAAGKPIDLGAIASPEAFAEAVISFSILDQATYRVIPGYESVTANTTLDFNTFTAARLVIRANTKPDTLGSVVFGYDGNARYRTENLSPYLMVLPAVSDEHTLTATPYGGNGATGAAGKSLTVKLTLIPKAVLFQGYYKLTVKHSGQVLDVDGGATFDGANVRQWRSNGSPAQQWLLEASADGYYTLKAKCSDKVLDVKYSSTASGANVWQWTPNNTDAQRWRISPVGNGYYQLLSKVSGKALDVANFSTLEGADVIQSTADLGDNQQWKIEPVAGAGSAATAGEVVVSWGGPTLRLHPNPATDAVVVAYEALNNGPATIDLQRLDRFRQERLRTVVDARAGVNQARVSVGHLPAGLYVVRVSSGSRFSFTKLIINR